MVGKRAMWVMTVALVAGAMGLGGIAAPTVELNLPEGVYRGAEFEVKKGVTNPALGVTYDAVRFDITVAFEEPVQSPSQRAEFFTVTAIDGDTEHDELAAFNASFKLADGAFTGHWWAFEGEVLPSGYDSTTTFTIQMTDTNSAPLGTYTLSLELLNVVPEPNLVLDGKAGVFELTDEVLLVGPGTPSDYQFNTIQAAIDAAQPGHTILVATGTYEEDLLIPAGKDGLELRPAPGAAPIIEGLTTAHRDNWPQAEPNIEILADNIKLHGFEIRSPVVPEDHYASGIVLDGTGIEIFGNQFLFRGDADADYSRCVGIQTYRTDALPGSDVSGLHIHNNTFGGEVGAWGYYGVFINRDEGSGLVTVEDNVFTGRMRAGIQTERSNTLIVGNDLSSNGWDGESINGLWVFDWDPTRAQGTVEVRGNTLRDLAGNAIVIGLTDNGAAQVLTNIEVTENTIENNDKGIVVRSSPGGVTVTGNNIVGNAVFGVENAAGPVLLDAACNWWGAATGPGGAGFGTGDPVSVDVGFVGWLNAPWPDGVCVGGPTITLALPDALVGGVDRWTPFSTKTENPDPGAAWEGVRYRIIVEGPDVLEDSHLDLAYHDPVGDTWEELPWTEEAGTLVTWLGPAEGFDLTEGWDLTTDFRARAGADAPLGTYGVTMELVFVNPGGPIASVEGAFDVLAAPTLTSEAFPFTLFPGAAFELFTLTADNTGGADYDAVAIGLGIEGPTALLPEMFRLQQRQNGTWVDVMLVEDDDHLVGLLTDPAGVALPPDGSVAIELRLKANVTAIDGDYTFSSELHYVGEEPGWLLASFAEPFLVREAEIPYDWYFSAGLHLLSVPLVPEDNVPETVFHSVIEAGMPVVLKEWIPEASYHDATEVDPGRGYWLWLTKGLEIAVEGMAPSGEYAVELPLAGWNLVSTPRWTVAWASLSFTRGDTMLTLEDAIAAGWIEPYAFLYSSTDAVYHAIELPGTTAGMEPWRGYWLKTLVADLTVEIPLGDEAYLPPTPTTLVTTAELPVRLQPPAAPRIADLGAGMLGALGYPNPVSGGQATFRVTGLPVDRVRVSVLDLGGRRVWHGENAGNQLGWNLTNSAGQAVANGVYIYVMEAQVLGQWVPVGYHRLLITR